MQTEFGDNVLDYWKLLNRNSVVKMKRDDGLDCDNDVKNTLPSLLGAFLSNSKQILHFIIKETNGFLQY